MVLVKGGRARPARDARGLGYMVQGARFVGVLGAHLVVRCDARPARDHAEVSDLLLLAPDGELALPLGESAL